MASAKYIFSRSRNPAGFLSSQKVGTDALNALVRWRAGHAGRNYHVITEDDTCLRADLEWDVTDDGAGVSLSRSCDSFGVEREFISA